PVPLYHPLRRAKTSVPVIIHLHCSRVVSIIKTKITHMSKDKWILMGVTFVVAVAAIIVANILQNKVAPINKLAKQ
ncbi:MAG: hypothetical protein WBO32_16445, partial [Cyclobacteriaceae bacterium]